MRCGQEAELQNLRREIELETRELVLHQAYSQVFRHNPREKLRFDEHVRMVRQRIRELEEKSNEVRARRFRYLHAMGVNDIVPG